MRKIDRPYIKRPFFLARKVRRHRGDFCLEALDTALARARRESGGAISVDGRERALDTVFVERLWRTVKYEEVYAECCPTA